MAPFKQPLTKCPSCKLHAVIPIMDECVNNAETDRWLLSLLCTACRMHREVLVTQAQAEAFDAALDAETHRLKMALARMEQENMREAGERFVRALNADAILPEDFVR